MADYLAAQITIGGCISRGLVPGLCRTIREEGLALEWGEASFVPESTEELLAARQLIDGDFVLRLCDDQARYGEFDTLEAFLIKRRIPFDRHSEAHYDYAPALLVYRPERGRQQWLATTGGQPLVPAIPLWDLADELNSLHQRWLHSPRQATDRKLREALIRLRGALQPRPTPLPAFEIGKSVGLRKAA